MKVIALSGSKAAIPTLDHLLKTNHLSALICPSETTEWQIAPLQDWAANNGLPCWQAQQITIEKELSELIRETKPDLILVYGFPYALPQSLLQPLKYGAWNIHFSLHPDNKGSITIHQLVDSKSKEQILQQCNVSLLPAHEAGGYIDQMSLISVALLEASIETLRKNTKHAGELPAVSCN
jgi:methionyl-tRNA formyltransferase